MHRTMGAGPSARSWSLWLVIDPNSGWTGARKSIPPQQKVPHQKKAFPGIQVRAGARCSHGTKSTPRPFVFVRT